VIFRYYEEAKGCTGQKGRLVNKRNTISIVFNGHLPFVRHPELSNPSQELCFFESISETFIPLLEVFDRLDKEHIHFRMAISLSPVLCHMLTDELLIQRYLEYTNRQVIFGEQELQRTAADPKLNALVRHFYNRVVEKKAFFSGRYENNIIKGFEYYQKKGRLEILTTAATHAFLPFYAACPEAIRSQFEVAISAHRNFFGKSPQGFWLPELGWKAELDSWFRAYNIGYTIVDTHALAFARPFAEKGSYYPVRTPMGIVIFGRDFYSTRNMAEINKDPVFRDNNRDQGFELPTAKVELFLGPQGSRTGTGYKYWAADNSGTVLYDPGKANESAKSHACSFLNEVVLRLNSAAELADSPTISLCAFDADSFGRFWHEGPEFIEALFREGVKNSEIQFMTPSEYYCKQDSASFQQVLPEFSSWGTNGYAETWLDASNDWMYRHALRALDRMVEIVERFPDNSGLKERALNQAAREILLAISSDWTKMLYKQENADYARSRIEGSLRNFTTIYEALGSNYISTEWLTQLEKRNNIFPNISYRVFRRRS
jgi:1,4-alpha-glucan branching enzyme